MGNNIDAQTESMIESFLKYGVKDALSVDDFLKFRQQAVHETEIGFQYHNPAECKNDYQNTEKASDTFPDKKAKNNLSIQNNETREKDKVIEKDINRGNGNIKIKNTQNDNTEFEKEKDNDNEKTFSDADFLAMMREIED